MTIENSDNEERFLDDPDTVEEPMDDEDATQCVETDNIINAKDSTSDSSQREVRYEMHQTKQKRKAEAMRQAKLDQKAIEQRKASGQLPKLIKKDRRSTHSNNYVWQVFEEVDIVGFA